MEKHCRTMLFSRKFCIRRVLRHTSRHDGMTGRHDARPSRRPSGRAVCFRARPDGPVTTGRHDGSCVAGLKLTLRLLTEFGERGPAAWNRLLFQKLGLFSKHNTTQFKKVLRCFYFQSFYDRIAKRRNICRRRPALGLSSIVAVMDGHWRVDGRVEWRMDGGGLAAVSCFPARLQGTYSYRHQHHYYSTEHGDWLQPRQSLCHPTNLLQT